MLAECVASVEEQTLPAAEHLIRRDDELAGRNGRLANEMAAATGCEWLAPFADDDLMLPFHLETLAAEADRSDVVYSWCQVTGRAWNPNSYFDPDALRQVNYIPAAALIRRELWAEIGGWTDAHNEDHDFWLRALDAGARFTCVPTITWVYRFGYDGHLNKSIDGRST